ncbi:hypothetical protein [Azohydromonas caseinilytica]|uniref:PEP-CTERM protein-sorting domain-containing protein n=1 Tax=Azohydromonas caseinilytica TaxID=2728836 RepID=A0A848FGH4_9BURK|nr:hypothetical protein [Azohydromonas caseinilytica]NML18362.1 hypothetical protein [Azohydromonas caseinilytica]
MARFIHRAALAVLAACAASGAFAQEAPRYRVRDLNALTGLDSISVSSLNNRGDVTLIENHSQQAFLWRGGRLHDLGAWGGGRLALNERGAVVGTRRLGDGSRVPFLWRNGRSINLASALGADTGEAYDINESGQVLGQADGRAFVWDGRRARYLDIPGTDFFTVAALNDAGVIAGGLGRPGDEVHLRAYLLRDGTVRTLPEPVDMAHGGSYRATALNNAGHAITLWRDAGQDLLGTALYLDGGYLNLGAETFAQDLNDRDWATGYRLTLVDEDRRQFTALLFRDGQAFELNRLMTPGSDARWDRLDFANALNDRGQILGGGTLSDGSGRAFLATPVPEAPVVVGMLAGLAVLGAVRWGRRREECTGLGLWVNGSAAAR